VLYYQFDRDRFEKDHYYKGYFDYYEDGFGAVATTANDLLENLESLLEADFKVPDKYHERADKFFGYRDCFNCQRIYDSIVKL
jgi:CDP-glycerol glycerophosphotransferase (TagB/SpsB family)